MVRFSPDGNSLATAGDDGMIMLWRDKGMRTIGGVTSAGVNWAAFSALRGHTSDVYDLCWSPDGARLFSGCVDGTCIVWDMATLKVLQTFRDHEHFVQGVAWDPRDDFLVSMSSDRTARVYSGGRTGKGGAHEYSCCNVLTKRLQPASPSGHGAADDADDFEPSTVAKPKARKTAELFLDESVPSFFRRLSWSPDGEFLLLPCGQHQLPGSDATLPTTHVFARGALREPCAHLPGPTKPVVATRCCPVLFELRGDAAAAAPAADAAAAGAAAADGAAADGAAADGAAGEQRNWMALPYRVLWAVASLDAVMLYDSQHAEPLLLARNMHYAALSDIAWLPNGRGLLVSSTDGYCSLLVLSPGALGKPLPAERVPECMRKKAPAPAPAAPVAPPAPPPSTAAPAAPASTAAPGGKKRLTPVPISAASAASAPAAPPPAALPTAAAAAAPNGGKKRLVPTPITAGGATEPPTVAAPSAPTPAAAAVAPPVSGEKRRIEPVPLNPSSAVSGASAAPEAPKKKRITPVPL